MWHAMRSAVACWALLVSLEVTCHAEVGEEEVAATVNFEEPLVVTSKQKDTIAALQRENQQLRDQLERGCVARFNVSRPISVSRGPANSRRLKTPGVDRGCIGYFKWDAISFTDQTHVADFATRSCKDVFSEFEPGRVVIGRGVRDLTPLRSWERIYGDLRIQNTNGLLSLEGLGNLSLVTGKVLIINNTEWLTDLSALQGVRRTGPLDIGNNAGLVALAGLHNIEEAVGSVRIWNNSRLENLTGLASLQLIGGDLVIMENPALKSLLGLGKLQAAGLVKVFRNRNMQYLGGPFCHSPSVRLKSFQFLDEDEDPCGHVIDPLDAFPRCVTPSEWEALGSSKVNYALPKGAPATPRNWNCPVQQRLCTDLDHWRKSRGRGTGRCKEGPTCGPDPVVCLWKQPCRINLADLNVSHRGAVFCPSCGSCGSCGENETTRVVGYNGTVDLQAFLWDRDPGSYTLCRCGDDLGPLVPIELQGARNIRQTSCTMGVACRIEAEFDEYAFSTSDVWLVPVGTGCGAEPADLRKISGVYADDGSVMFSAMNLALSLRPGDYELCWRPSGGEYSPQALTTANTAVKIRGPFKKATDDQHRAGDLNLEIRYDGLGFSNEFRKTNLVNDTMRLVPKQGGDEKKDICGATALYEARSVDGSFNFNFIASEVNPGWLVKCWCYNETSSCVNTGSIRVVCPTETVEAGGRCERCPVGTKFKKEGDCALHGEYWWFLGMQNLSLFWFLFLLLVQLGMPIRVQDTFMCSGELYAETAYPHWCRCYGRRSFRILFTSTRNPNLDTPRAPLRARPNTVQSLRILAENGAPISECWDTSHGFVHLPLWEALWHKGWPLPAAVLLLLNTTFYIGILSLRVRQELLGTVSEFSGVVGALALALTLRVLSRCYSRSERLTELDKLIRRFRKRLRIKNPEPVACAKGPGRAVALSELFDIWEHFQAYIRERNAYYMDTNILGPLTKPDQLSYAEVAGPALVSFFVSHYWGNPFQDLCKTLKKHAEMVCASARTSRTQGARTSRTQRDNLWKEEKYWICFFSNNQYRLDDELGAGWDTSSFFLTLQSGHCKGVCLALDTLAAPLTRAWCIFELLQTLILEEKTGDCGQADGFMGLHLCTEGGVLNEGQGSAEVTLNLVERICRLDLENADASSVQDKEMIHKQVEKSMGSFKKMNAKVRQKFDGLLKRAKRQQDSSFSSVYRLLRDALQEDASCAADAWIQQEASLRGSGAGVAVALEWKDGESALVQPDTTHAAPGQPRPGGGRVDLPADPLDTSQVVHKLRI